MMTYIALSILTILTGQGLLRCFRLSSPNNILLYLAPIIAMVFWSLSLAWGILLGFSVKQLSPLLWTLTFFLALNGGRVIYSHYLQKIWQKDWLILLCVLFLPVAIMSVFFWNGIDTYLGSFAPDGWAYDAYGQYIWKYSRGTEGGLAPLYQYAASMINTRFISSALLSFFSPITGHPGDTQAVASIYVCWVFFLLSASCIFFFRSQHPAKSGIFYLVITIFSAWLIHLVSLNNYDNALILGFLPAFAGIAANMKPEQLFRWILPIGMMVASILYCYIELSPFILVSAFLFFFLKKMLLSEYSKKTLFIFSSSILIVVIIFCSPFLKQMIEFIHWQTIVASRPPGSRPGDHTFMELLNPHHWTATYWGFFGISVANLTLSKIISLLGVLLGTILFFLMLTGQYIFFQEKKFNFLSVGFLLFCATLWMIIYNHYSYGAYKLILISWWLMTYGVAVSVDYWINRKKYLKIGFGIISIVYISLTLFTMLSFNKSPTVIKNMTSYRELINVQKIIGSNPVMVSVTDNYSNIWAVYYLRDAHIYLTEYKLYMADHTSLMTRSEIQKKADIHFLLTDNNASLPIRNLIWSNKYFYLWKLPPHWAIVKDVINKNGIESWDDKIAFWLGDGDTIFNIMTNYSGNATFSANFSIGPSLKNKTTVQLLITNKNNNFKKYLTIAHPTTLSISVPVKKGNNILILRALDKANNLMTTDPRPMLIGVRNLH